MKSIIVAYDNNRGIGADNDLMWQGDLPADSHYFKQTTNGHTIIMGRRTYESLRGPLPNRQNIVISRDLAPVDGFTVVRTLNEAYAASTDSEIFVIGGGQIYELALNTVDQLLITEVDGTFQADVYFPEIDMTIWQETARKHHDKDESNKYNYDFVTYTRR